MEPPNVQHPSQLPPHQFTTPYSATHPHPMQSKSLPLVLINLATFLLSIPILVMGIWLAAARHHADCLRFLEWPLIVMGVVMMVVSLIGLVGAWRRKVLLLWLYIVLLTLIILLLLCFLIFTYVVTRGSKGHSVQGPGSMKEYVLGDYSYWMWHKVQNTFYWNDIKRCLMKDHVCSDMDLNYPSESVMFSSELSYAESGCCKPPTSCSFTFVRATYWINPASPAADPDCSRWSNDPRLLCYNCDACKAGVIRTVNKDWRKAAKVMLAMLVALVLLYALAWFALLQALAT